jgi:hypothetical protein
VTLKDRWIWVQQMWEKDLWYGRPIYEMFTASLESLKLYIYDDLLIYDRWAEDLTSLFKRKALQFPELKEIWVKYWTDGDSVDADSSAGPFEIWYGWKSGSLTLGRRELIWKFKWI